MATEIFSNLAQVYLSTPIVSTPAAGTVETWTGIVPFPTGPKFPVLAAGRQFTVAINTVNRGDRTPELVAVTANSTPGTWTVVRGAGGSTVKTHLAGDVASGAAFDAAGTPFATSTQFAAVPSGTSVSLANPDTITGRKTFGVQGSAAIGGLGASPSLERFAHGGGSDTPNSYFDREVHTTTFTDGGAESPYICHSSGVGWNMDGADTTEPSFGLSIEHKFRNGNTDPFSMEMHHVFTGADAVQRRMLSHAVERTTAAHLCFTFTLGDWAFWNSARTQLLFQVNEASSLVLVPSSVALPAQSISLQFGNNGSDVVVKKSANNTLAINALTIYAVGGSPVDINCLGQPVRIYGGGSNNVAGFVSRGPLQVHGDASGVTIFSGAGVPSNAMGVNGDEYHRTDGGAGSFIYQKRSGAFVATGA